MSELSTKLIDEVLLQLKHRGDVLKRIEATISEQAFTYRRGVFIKKNSVRKEYQSPVEEAWLDDFFNLNKILNRAKINFMDIICHQQNEAHLYAIPKLANNFDPPNSFIDTIVIKKEPTILSCIEVNFIHLPWWLKWPRFLCVNSFYAYVKYEYFQAIPLPTKISIRIVTRGIGSWRYGGGEDTKIQYKLSTI